MKLFFFGHGGICGVLNDAHSNPQQNLQPKVFSLPLICRVESNILA